jgi:hypothetical protein
MQVATDPLTHTGVYTFHGLKELAINKPQPIIENLLFERQNAILAGQFAIGKSLLCLQLSLCIATGTSFLGRQTRRSRVAFIDGENDIGEIKSRIERQSLALDIEDLPEESWTYLSATDMDSEYCGLGLRGELSKVGSEISKLDTFLRLYKPEVLFLDNLGWFIAGDIEKAEDVRTFYETLRELRARHESLENGAIIALHHLTKPGERIQSTGSSLLENPRGYLYQARGSGRLVDFAEARLALAVETTTDTSFTVLNGVNRSGQVQPLIMQLDTESLCFRPHEDKRLVQEKVFHGHRKKLEGFERLPNQFTFREAERCSGIAKQTLVDMLDMAKKAGLLTHSNEGVYRKVADKPPEPVDRLDPVDRKYVLTH